MHIVHMPGVIQIVANRVFPISPLPDAAFAFRKTHGRQPLRFWDRFGERDLDRFPTEGVVNIIRRQGPDTMHVIGQHHPAIDMKRSRRTNLPHSRAQYFDLIDQQASPAFQQINGKEIRSTRNAIAAVVGHGRILPEPMSAYGGRRFAFPPYDSSLISKGERKPLSI